MSSLPTVLFAAACLVACGGSFSSSDSRGAGGQSSGGANSGGALQAGNGGAAQSGAAGAARGGAAQGGAAQGGAAQGGHAGVSGFGGACSSNDSGATAQPVTFVLHTNTPVYVKETCTLAYQLTAACSGSKRLSTDAFCVADCSNTTQGCIACGACFSGARAVTPSAPQQIVWNGEVYEFGTTASGCSCATGHAAPPGAYTFSIDAYLTAEDAIAGTNGYTHRVDFTLPAPDGTVSVDLGFIGI